jgi:hypothetical protein
MTRTLERTVRQSAPATSRRSLSRVLPLAMGALALIAGVTRPMSAQSDSVAAPRWELRFTSGAFVGTGSQRRVLKDSPASAAQLSWVVRPSLAITSTFGWARSRDLGSFKSPRLDVFSYDVGVEARPAMWFARRAVTFSPFAGVGAGGRSYNYRKLDVDATNNAAAYAAMGGEVGVGRVAVRLELRDYVSGFSPLTGAGESFTRNDLSFMAGLRFNRQRGARH